MGAVKATDPEARAAAVELARRPVLWPTAVAAGARHLPRPGRSAGPWLRFRMETAYGRERSLPTGDDLVTWLAWARAWPRSRR